MWLHLFMKEPAAAAFISRISLPSKSRTHKEGTLTSYCKVVNHLFETYAMDDVIEETDAKIMHYTPSADKKPIESTELLWSKALRCDRVYVEYVLKGIFIEDLHKSIRHIMGPYWESKKNATMQDLASHSTSLMHLKYDSQLTDSPNFSDHSSNLREKNT